MQCPNCSEKHVEIREYYEDGVVTDQLHECQKCFFTGDKHDFSYSESLISMAKEKIKYLKFRSLRKGIDFNLELFDVIKAYSVNRCELTGIKLVDAASPSDKILFNNRTFDRVDHKKGYVKGNVLIICHSANKLKAKYETPGYKNYQGTPEELLQLVKDKLLSEWHKKPEVYGLGTN